MIQVKVLKKGRFSVDGETIEFAAQDVGNIQLLNDDLAKVIIAAAAGTKELTPPLADKKLAEKG